MQAYHPLRIMWRNYCLAKTIARNRFKWCNCAG